MTSRRSQVRALSRPLYTMKKIFIIFAVWFVVINIFALIALNRFTLTQDTAYDWIKYSELSQEQTWNPIPLHAKWDSFWYLDIVENGYSFKETGPGNLSNIVFFPLYPLLLKIISFFLGGNIVLAGWALSSTFLLLALFYLFKLVKEFHPQIDPYLPNIFLLIFPSAFFLNTVYTESLFLFLSLAAFYYTRKQNLLLGGLFGFLASLTRITGILLLLPLTWEYLQKRNFHLRELFRPSFLPLLLTPLGTLLFFLFHYIRFGDFFLFFRVQYWWGRTFTFNQDHFLFLTNSSIANFTLDILFVITALFVTFLVFKKIRVSYGLYMLAIIGVALSTGTLMSIGRYMLVLFPIYILAASIRNKYIQQSWLLISILLLALYTILFVNNYWAG